MLFSVMFMFLQVPEHKSFSLVCQLVAINAFDYDGPVKDEATWPER